MTALPTIHLTVDAHDVVAITVRGERRIVVGQAERGHQDALGREVLTIDMNEDVRMWVGGYEVPRATSQ